MATAEGGKKRRSLDSDGAMEHRSKKKRKDSSARAESHSKSKSSRKRKKSKRKDSTPPKIRTLGELAKLVSSGAVRIPKSLLHYVDDRAVLLDQVFTILSPDDVKGMLPDILKGLKMRTVKQLCLEQLKSMTRDEVCQTLCPKDESQPDLSFDTVIRELMGKEKEEEEDEGEPLVRDGKGIETESAEQTASVSSSLSCDSSSYLKRASTKNLAKAVTDPPFLLPCDVVHCSKKEEEGKEGEERAMCISKGSDVSDDDSDREKAIHSVKRAREEEMRDSDANRSHARQHTAVISSSEHIESDDQLELRVGILDDKIDRELNGEEERAMKADEEEEEADEEEEEGEEESDSDEYTSLEDYWRSAYAEDVPEASRLLEMELRKRALESELRRSSVTVSPLEEVKPKDPSPVAAMENKSRTSVETAPSHDELDREAKLPDTDPSLGQSLELLMRQRALQSLAKRRHTD